MPKVCERVYLLRVQIGEPPADHLTAEHSHAIRSAMLSVYYESLGRQFEITGAPSVLLPPQARTQPLAESLEALNDSPPHLLAALWLLVRGVRDGEGGGGPGNYPVEMLSYIEPGSLAALVQRRRYYRAGANLFAAALVACRDGYWDQFDGLSLLLKKPSGLGISEVTSLLMRVSADECLDNMSKLTERERSQTQIRCLEREVGLNIYDFVEQLADAAAFYRFANEYICPTGFAHDGGLLVFPASSVIRQDRRTLTTSATATTLVSGKPVALGIAMDPQAWGWSSDVIGQTCYVRDPFTLEEPFPSSQGQHTASEPLGLGFDGVRFLKEDAVFAWGPRSDERSSFNNVLNVRHRVAHPGLEEQRISVEFSLCRSIGSSVMWDRRSGGLQLNQGFMKARPLGQGIWRVTWRKLLRFSDRTPYAGTQGLLDLGQMLNYLAPAALTWWVESEIYSMQNLAYSKHAALSEGSTTEIDEEQA